MKTPYIDVKVRIYTHQSLKGVRRGFSNSCKKWGVHLLAEKTNAWAWWNPELLATKKREGEIHIVEKDYSSLSHEIRHIIEGHFHIPPFV